MNLVLRSSLVASLLLAGCAESSWSAAPPQSPPGGNPQPQGAPPPYPPPQGAPPSSPPPNAPPGPGDPGTLAAPVVLTLSQGNFNAQTNETDVVATIDVSGPISYPAMLTVTPPRSGQLTAGMPQEQLSLSQAGRLQRVFRIRTQGPLSAQDPVHVTLQGQAASGGAGFRADRDFPHATTPPPPTGPTGPRPPGGRPPFGH